MASQFHDLLVEQLPRMRAYAMAFARNRAAADDLLQQTALKAWNAQTQFVAGTNFKAWLYKIMRNEHINTYRRQKAPHMSLDLVPEEFLGQAGDSRKPSCWPARCSRPWTGWPRCSGKSS